LRSLLTSQHRAHAGQQLGHLKRLEQIIIGPAIQAAQSIIEAVAGGDDEQWNRIVFSANAGQHLQPILTWKAKIEQHQVIVLATQCREGGLPFFTQSAA
jgi:hypothetical protein